MGLSLSDLVFATSARISEVLLYVIDRMASKVLAVPCLQPAVTRRERGVRAMRRTRWCAVTR